MRILTIVLLSALFALNAAAMSADGCGAGSCADCHSITIDEAQGLLGDMVDRVNTVEFAEVPGLWIAEIEKNQRKVPVYIDFSKKYVISGNVYRLADRENVTADRDARMNKVDVSRIPLDDALLIGRESAPQRVIVFTDPQCPYCKKLHVELKKVVASNPEIAFLIKLFPLKMHPEAYGIAQSVVCNKSLEFLELSFAGKPVPPALCKTDVVDQTMALAGELGIHSTPTLVLPNGLIAPGSKPAARLIKLIGENQAE